MTRLDQELKQLVQRTGSSTGRLRTDSDRVALSVNVRTDLAAVMQQLNSVYKPLVESLSSTDTLNALDFGLSGNIIFANASATEASASVFYDTALSRPRTIKECMDVFVTEVQRLETEISRGVVATDGYDDTALADIANKNNLNLAQLRADSMGPNYTFGNDGAIDLTYSLAQHIDVLGSFFSGFPGTGNTYTASYPVVTLNQSSVTDLSTHLSNIRDFVGMSGAASESPTYSTHGPVNVVSDGDNIEVAIQALDEAITNVSGGDYQQLTTAGAVAVDWTTGDTALIFGEGDIVVSFTDPSSYGTELTLVLSGVGAGIDTVTWPGTVNFIDNAQESLTRVTGVFKFLFIDTGVIEMYIGWQVAI